MNAVVIVADDMPEFLLDHMPQTLAMGTRFTNAYNTNPVCCASRCSMFEGRYSHSTTIWGNNPPFGGYGLWMDADGSSKTIVPKLRDLGWRTGMFGKYINGYADGDVSDVGQGWTDFLGITSYGAPYYDTRFSQNGELYQMPPAVYQTDFLAWKAASFLWDVAAKQQPFLLWLTPVAPHKEHVPAPRHADTFGDLEPARPPSFDTPAHNAPEHWAGLDALTAEEKAEADTVRLQMHRTVLALDDFVGLVVQTLEQTGLAEDTMVIVASDNGFSFGEHRLVGKSIPYREATHMPLVIHMPGAEPDPEALIQHIDFLPTVAEMAGVEPDAPFDGASMLGVLHGGYGRSMLYLEGHVMGARPAWVQVQRRNRTYTCYATGEEEWFNLETDPYQTRNVREPAPALLEECREFAQAWVAEFPPPGWRQPDRSGSVRREAIDDGA